MRFLTGLLLFPVAAGCWDRQKAFEYLESRQQEWANWKPAQKAGGPCISCHTGLPYMIARRMAGENRARPLENDLVQGVRSRLLSNPPKTMLSDGGAEVILNLLTLALQRRSSRDPLDEADRVAIQRLWEKQIKEGEFQGAWSWYNLDLHPVESQHSRFFGATLAAMALSAYPAEQPGKHTALLDFLQREMAKQPLHNRMAWVAFGPEKKTKSTEAVLEDLWAAQSSDGGWSSAALGPWAKHNDAPPDAGSNAYATAWAAFTARRSGVPCSDPRLKRALDWLEQRQDPKTGAWNAVSMNKVYPAGSMQLKFMTDAATGYAAAALVGCQP